MRVTFTLLGVALILVYAISGALVMNDWAVVAASGLPLDQTIAVMDAAEQPYSTIPGIVFASLGGVFALAWASMTLHPARLVSNAGAAATWAGIVALGAPAFFFASFGNMNSVGDTFADWNAEAAFALEFPLYIASAIAAAVGVGSAIVAAAAIVRRPRHDPSAERERQVDANLAAGEITTFDDTDAFLAYLDEIAEQPASHDRQS